MLRGRVPTAEVEEASVVVVLAVVATSAVEAAGPDPAGQQVVDRRFQTSHAIVTRFPHPHVHCEQFRNVD
jgi:hypothetical protein